MSARVFRSLDEARGQFGPSALSIGNFDGVHRGHQSLYGLLRQQAAQLGAKASVLTFDPHPTRVVAPSRAPRLLSTIEQRIEWMSAAGVEQVLVLPFDAEFAKLTARQFVERVLVEACGARFVSVGENFRFGNRQAGDTQLLAQLGEELGYRTEIAPVLVYRGRVVSSTAVRALVESGQVAWAWRLLNRPYALEGSVVSGHGIGSKQTVPTLNLDTAAEVLPARGVYVTVTDDLESDRSWNSVTNVGFRPTFNGDALTIETFLLGGLPGDPPSRIRVCFLHRLREERKFPSPVELKAQILRDVGRARAYFRRTVANLKSIRT